MPWQWRRQAEAGDFISRAAASYEVTKSERTRRRLRGLGGSADRHLDEMTLWKMREICRYFDRNSPLLHGIIERWADNVIGPTFSFQPQTEDNGWNEAAKEYVAERMDKRCDARRQMTFRRLARTWLRAIPTDGDILPVFTEAGFATFEADQLVSPGRGASAGGKVIINGVEVEPTTGAAVAFWVGRRKYNGLFDRLEAATRIAAQDALFPANLDRVSATRGVPALSSSLGLFDRIDDYIDNEMLAAELGSRLTLFLTKNAEFWNSGTLPPGVVEGDVNTTGSYDKLLKVYPGSVTALEPMEDVKNFDNKRPGVTFEPTVLVCMRMIGCGLGMPLELVLLDFSRTNYSSARASLLQAYRTFLCWQEFAKEEILIPPYQRWIGQAIVEKALPLRDDAMRVKCLMPQWAWIDPWREIQAAEKATSMGIDTLTDAIEREQETLGDYIRRRKAELDAFRAAGIPTSTAPNNLPGGGANTKPLKDEDEVPEKEPVEVE